MKFDNGCGLQGNSVEQRRKQLHIQIPTVNKTLDLAEAIVELRLLLA
jgi:hypothetical protein